MQMQILPLRQRDHHIGVAFSYRSRTWIWTKKANGITITSGATRVTTKLATSNLLGFSYTTSRQVWTIQTRKGEWTEREREREIKFIGLFENRGHRGPYSPYKPFNHNLYIGIIIFPHIDNPQYTGYDLPKKKPNKIINAKKWGPN